MVNIVDRARPTRREMEEEGGEKRREGGREGGRAGGRLLRLDWGRKNV
jgi:hypothetical protein